MFKNLKSKEDRARIETISEEQWLKYYQEILADENKEMGTKKKWLDNFPKLKCNIWTRQ